MGKLFGTDGIRGIANDGLDASLAFKVGQTAATVLAEEKHSKPKIAIGKDTRISSDMLEAALISGICSAGADVLLLGVVPTPAVAYITSCSGSDAGIMISASHNPYEYNGIKIFDSRGCKLSDELEEEIENLIISGGNLPYKTGSEIGRIIKNTEKYVQMYVAKLASSAGKISKMKVAVDCANGASYRTARSLFSKFPLELHFICDSPDGININENCGSTDTSSLSREVIRQNCDIGIAFDGDADRLIVIDEKGEVVDGDKIMAICGRSMKNCGKLRNNTVIATVMSNLGFHEFAETNGITLLTSAVGDRNVLEMMRRHDACLGGENSGHLIFLDESTTGDGQLAAVKFLSILSSEKRTVSELASEIPVYPQFLISVPFTGDNNMKNAVMEDERLKNSLLKAEMELGNSGRLLVRPSGTENLIRVMTEAKDENLAFNTANNLVEVIKSISV